MSGFDVAKKEEAAGAEDTKRMRMESIRAALAAAEGASSTVSSKAPPADLSTMSQDQIAAYLRKQELLKAQADYAIKMAKKDRKEGNVDEHKFWDTQPMAKKGEVIPPLVNEAVDKNTDVAKVRQDPYGMPAGFEWCVIDVTDADQLTEMYNLLRANYVEDDDAMFRFDYSREFLLWALTVPGFQKQWHVGVRAASKEEGVPGKLMATITAVPAEVQCHGVEMPMVEINFLCVHKKLREKRLSPMLIREITRRVNLTGRWQAVYTAGTVLPGCKAKCRYWHRTLQVEKLVDVKFSYCPRNKTMAEHVKHLAIPSKTRHPLKPMQLADVPEVTVLLNTYVCACVCACVFAASSRPAHSHTH